MKRCKWSVKKRMSAKKINSDYLHVTKERCPTPGECIALLKSSVWFITFTLKLYRLTDFVTLLSVSLLSQDIFVSLSQVDGMYFVCNIDDFKFLADMIQHIPLNLRSRYVFCTAPINKKQSFVCTSFLKVSPTCEEGMRWTEVNWRRERGRKDWGVARLRRNVLIIICKSSDWVCCDKTFNL